MKVLGKKTELCITCHSCEVKCSRTWFDEANYAKACIRIKLREDKKITTCTQCGTCIDACPVKAISRDASGVVRIDKEICTGCFKCAEACPESAMRVHEAYSNPFKCVVCGKCADVCPRDAIFVEER